MNCRIFAFFLLLIVKPCYSSYEDDLKIYIIYTGEAPKNATSELLKYQKMLQQVAERKYPPKVVLLQYKLSFGGFVAKLTATEAHRMKGLEGVVLVIPNRGYKLDDTDAVRCCIHGTPSCCIIDNP